MKRFLILSVALFVVFCFGSAFAADSQPSAKATAMFGNIAIVDSTALVPTAVFTQYIKTANQKDLFIDMALESGLYTRTKSGKNATVDTSTAKSSVKVAVFVDDVMAAPGWITFNEREQTLTTLLGQVLVGDVLQDEYVELILKTMAANAFNFIVADLPSGLHKIEVKAKIETSTSSSTGTTANVEAKATLGYGSVTIESVRMIRNEDIVLE